MSAQPPKCNPKCNPKWKPTLTTPDDQHTVVYQEDVKYVTLDHIIAAIAHVLIMKAAMGIGKTSAVIAYLNTLPPDARVVVLTPRRSFAKTACAEFNLKCEGEPFVNYLGKSGKDVIKSGRLFIQVESLWKLVDPNEGVVKPFDVVIVDECESILTQAVAYETNQGNITKNHEVFEQLVKTCKNRCFFMDAFISDRTFRVVKHLGLGYKYLNYLRRPVKRNAIRWDTSKCGETYLQAVKNHDFTCFINNLIDNLKDGLKIYMFVSSKRGLGQIVDTVKKELPDTRVLAYHGDIKTPLDDIRTSWSEQDLVITTSKITVGCNFDVEGVFDKVYIYVNGASGNLIRDAFQSHMRVRHLKDDEMHYFLDPTPVGATPYLSRAQIVAEFQKGISFNKRLFGDMWEPTSQLWIDLFLDTVEERNHSVRQLVPMFLHYLEECNYHNMRPQPEDLDDDEVLVKMEKLVEFEYSAVPELTTSQLKALKSQRIDSSDSTPVLTELEKAQIERYYFDSSLLDDNMDAERTAKLWKVYHKLGRTKFNQVRHELGIDAKELILADVLTEGRGDMWNQGFQLRLKVIQNICQTMGFRNSLEFQQISRAEFVKRIESSGFRELKEEGTSAFEIRDQSKKEKPKKKDEKPKKPVDAATLRLKDALFFVDSCLQGWSGSALKLDETRARKRVNGVMTDITGLSISPISDELKSSVRPRARKDIEIQRIREWEVGHDARLTPQEVINLNDSEEEEEETVEPQYLL